ncbi:MAG TPA: hypothetical protein VJ044_10825 [Candidatus Hodarchaeales archaeon]|uniref:Uncharacterized protein n=2 Tax=Candidatus Chisholmiibacteriota TaxID=1817900 RepID=A0A1G1VLL4_9BACT|nr:MAG: hypothetical protein A2785_01535 [Candidatus Chisholmbacteria bacterium RIFCSPHIGHO2_01_FULL_49_18]OGY21773.1 MAG: hypothetical protein A3A65_02285 [Candidatus Chisholmbacteria bacterium RIFCSPLOWO2_01_FULL_49_14]HKZ41447.1 hypothetical protein [Candidatus Hodarchaeales archaeon]
MMQEIEVLPSSDYPEAGNNGNLVLPFFKEIIERIHHVIHRIGGDGVGEQANSTQGKIVNYNPDDYLEHGQIVDPTTVHVPHVERIEEPILSSQQIEA